MTTSDRPVAPADGRAVVLVAGDAVVEVYPEHGGRVGQVRIGDQPLLVDVPDDPSTSPMMWGSFPMAPWAGRLREGRFTFAGRTYQLEINHRDGAGDPRRRHSIHGTVFARPWSVDDATGTGVALSCPLDGALAWPFGGTVTQRIEVAPNGLRCELAVTVAEHPFPAVVGWHPWFRRPDRLAFRPTAMYVRDGVGIPTGATTTPQPGPWDDCFVNTEPVGLGYDRPTAAEVTVTSDCDHWVVFDQLDHATCVEPQSGPPDAFNLAGPPDDGNRHEVVDVTAPLRRSMTISW